MAMNPGDLAAKIEAIRAKQRENSEARVLLPDRRQQANFFVADLVDYAIKDDQATMEAPVFSLSTQEDKKLWLQVSMAAPRSTTRTC